MGYGDVRATNTAEQAFLCVVLVITALTYSVIFGNVAVQIQELDRSKQLMNDKLTALTEFCRVHNLSQALLDKASEYVEMLWIVNRGLDAHKLLHTLPRHVREDVLLATHK